MIKNFFAFFLHTPLLALPHYSKLWTPQLLLGQVFANPCKYTRNSLQNTTMINLNFLGLLIRLWRIEIKKRKNVVDREYFMNTKATKHNWQWGKVSVIEMHYTSKSARGATGDL